MMMAANRNVNDFPNELIGRVLRMTSVADRLCAERVSPRWRALMWAQGWTEQCRLDQHIVFEGVLETRQKRRLTNQMLVALFHRVRASLRDLNMESFIQRRHPRTIEVCRHFYVFQRLEQFNFLRYGLTMELTSYLPQTLRRIQFTTVELIETILSTLAESCPLLEAIELYGGYGHTGIRVATMNAFIRRFPRLTKLWLRGDLGLVRGDFTTAVRDDRVLVAIQDLAELRDLNLSGFPLVDDQILQALTVNCQKLRGLCLNNYAPISDLSLASLANLPALVELDVRHPALTDDVLMEIAFKGQLKKLYVCGSTWLTDQSMLCLINNCKSLVSLEVFNCSRITQITLDALVAEINRRKPPLSVALPVPQNPLDLREVFYFYCAQTAINPAIAQQAAAANPWLCVEWNQTLADRKFY